MIGVKCQACRRPIKKRHVAPEPGELRRSEWSCGGTKRDCVNGVAAEWPTNKPARTDWIKVLPDARRY